jgi:hypothetical protein
MAPVWCVTDLGSMNGLLLNGIRVQYTLRSKKVCVFVSWCVCECFLLWQLTSELQVICAPLVVGERRVCSAELLVQPFQKVFTIFPSITSTQQMLIHQQHIQLPVKLQQ